MDSYQMNSLPAPISQPGLSPSFRVADILRLNQALSSDQQCPTRHRRRRTRTIYTREQLSSMEAVFASNQYPDITTRDAIGDAIDLTEARVQVWFQNRRTRQRRQAKRQDTDSISSNTSDSSTHSQSSVSSRASTPASPTSSLEASNPSSPKSCSRPGSNVSTPPTLTSNNNSLSGCKSPTVPSPTPPGSCTLSCCSPPSIYSAYSSMYANAVMSSAVTSNGQLPLQDAYSYSTFPTHYTYPSSVAYYYHPTAMTRLTSAYHRPTVFNFPPVSNASPVFERVSVSSSAAASF